VKVNDLLQLTVVVLFICECIKRSAHTLSNANVRRKTPIENHCIYLGSN
jgi:hypothetical protein